MKKNIKSKSIIMLIDDDNSISINEKRELQKLGYKIVPANSSEINPKKPLKNYSIDLILKKTEELISEEEEKFKTLTDDLPALICEFLPDSTLLFVNKTYSDYFKMKPSQLVGKKFLDFVHEDEKIQIKKTYLSLTPENPINDYIHKTIHNNKVKWQKWRDRAIFDENGNHIKFQSIGIDITEKKLMEFALEEEANLRNVLLDNIPNCFALVLKKNSFEIVASNKPARDIGAVQGKKCYEVFNKKNDNCSCCKAFELFEINKPLKLEVQHNGSWKHLIWAPLNKNMFIHYIFDISDTKEKEVKIKNLLKDKEVLLKETHHRIKNNMDIIKGILTIEASLQKEDSQCYRVLDDCIKRIITMHALYDHLYKNEIKHEISICYYLMNLISKLKDIHKQFSIKTNVNIEDINLKPKIVSSLGIIINEFFTNSAKYAFDNVKNPLITISLKKKNNIVKVIFADNGTGLSDTISVQNSSSFGFQLVNMLVEEIKGTIKTERKNGTKYTIKFSE